jgi:hypothetical protein
VLTPASRRTLVGVGLAALFVGALCFATAREAGVRCEVCVDFEGERACRTASGADRDKAVQEGLSTACAVLARGVTQAFACQRISPASIRCDD